MMRDIYRTLDMMFIPTSKISKEIFFLAKNDNIANLNTNLFDLPPEKTCLLLCEDLIVHS